MLPVTSRIDDSFLEVAFNKSSTPVSPVRLWTKPLIWYTTDKFNSNSKQILMIRKIISMVNTLQVRWKWAPLNGCSTLIPLGRVMDRITLGIHTLSKILRRFRGFSSIVQFKCVECYITMRRKLITCCYYERVKEVPNIWIEWSTLSS